MLRQSKNQMIGLAIASALTAANGAGLATGIGDKPMISPKAMDDALHLVANSDRTVPCTRKRWPTA